MTTWTAPGVETVELTATSAARHGASRGHDSPEGGSYKVSQHGILMGVVTTAERIQMIMGRDFASLTEGEVIMSKLIECRSISDDTLDGLTYSVSVRTADDAPEPFDPDDYSAPDHGTVTVVVVPVVDGHEYPEAAHGTDTEFGNMSSDGVIWEVGMHHLINGSRRYVRAAGGKHAADAYEDIPGIVPELISQVREALPAAIMAHARTAIALADALHVHCAAAGHEDPGEEDGPDHDHCGVTGHEDPATPDDGGFFEAVLR